jgi:hypothetical protein
VYGGEQRYAEAAEAFRHVLVLSPTFGAAQRQLELLGPKLAAQAAAEEEAAARAALAQTNANEPPASLEEMPAPSEVPEPVDAVVGMSTDDETMTMLTESVTEMSTGEPDITEIDFISEALAERDAIPIGPEPAHDAMDDIAPTLIAWPLPEEDLSVLIDQATETHSPTGMELPPTEVQAIIEAIELREPDVAPEVDPMAEDRKRAEQREITAAEAERMATTIELLATVMDPLTTTLKPIVTEFRSALTSPPVELAIDHQPVVAELTAAETDLPTRPVDARSNLQPWLAYEHLCQFADDSIWTARHCPPPSVPEGFGPAWFAPVLRVAPTANGGTFGDWCAGEWFEQMEEIYGQPEPQPTPEEWLLRTHLHPLYPEIIPDESVDWIGPCTLDEMSF